MEEQGDYSVALNGSQSNKENIYLFNGYNWLMPLPTRIRIMEQLRKHQVATASDLGRALGMTRANIRHHLIILETNDFVEVIARRHMGRGRPELVYALSRRTLGDGLDSLAAALLMVWLGPASGQETDDRLRALAGQLGSKFLGEEDAALPKRLSALIDHLNQLHYQARWEAGAQGARLIFGHCPFSAIIADHPELCRMDAFMLEQNTGRRVRQVDHLVPASTGLPQCVFIIS